MPELGAVADAVRSKNAGPFWITVDVFCGSAAAYDRVRAGLRPDTVAARLGLAPTALRRFDIDALRVVKLSLPRPVVQGAPADRDMHGASFAALLAEMEID